jgi:ubiquinone/menaquinone biosynthesis C-methylase UbiE
LVDSEAQREKLASYRDPALVARYDERWRGLRGPGRDRRKQRAILRALAALPTVESVLDVPCGTGRFSAFLPGLGLRYVGGDASLAMLLEASRKHASSRFLALDLAQLPFADRSVDLVVCIRLMHLVRDPELRAAFLREMARVARVGVIVDFRQRSSLRAWLGIARHRLGLRAKAPGALTHEQMRKQLEAAGLAPVAMLPVRRPAWIGDKLVVAARVTMAPRTAR